jgi:hypothetical protein
VDYVTSRRFSLPTDATEMARKYWYNLWRRRLWPYNNLKPGDRLWWTENKTRLIVWESRVVRVERFEYSSRNEAVSKFVSLFGWFEPEPYFEEAATSGFGLAYKVQPMKLLNMVRPPKIRLLQQGWQVLDPGTVEALTDEAAGRTSGPDF